MNLHQIASEVFDNEAQAILQLKNQLSEDFDGAANAILKGSGKVITTGIGKAGLVGRKIAATLASTGTPAFFFHPTEALHGDMGMISKSDIILALSNSGETEELLKILPFIKENGNILIAITGRLRSTLARSAHYVLNTTIEREACPFNLAPTTSTTVQMAMGDALALTLMKMRDFKSSDYARLHNGGSLGKRLLLRIGDVMRKEDLPVVTSDCDMIALIHTMSKGGIGLVVVCDESESIVGIITDGDMRRTMEKYRQQFFSLTANDITTKNPKTISPDARFERAESIMSEHKIHSLLVATPDNKLLGVVEIYDLIV